MATHPEGRTALDRLAGLAGIEASYEDVWGQQRDITAETKRALLAAMGLAVASDAEVQASLHDLEVRPWRRLLAPVRVLSTSEPVDLTFTLPETVGQAHLAWTLAEEGGQVHTGETRLDGLPVLAAAEIDGRRYRRHGLSVPVVPALGYHRFRLEVRGQDGSHHDGVLTLIVTPERCLDPGQTLGGARTWGYGVQLYALRSARNWGIGDFGDLAAFAGIAAGHGASFVGLNPLHALFPADPNHYGPYSPSNRAFLNVFYLDVTAVPDLAQCARAREQIADPAFQRRLAAARGGDLVDYPEVAALKLPVLETLYRSFRSLHLEAPEPTARGRDFRAFQLEMGEALHRHAVFQALHEHLFRDQQGPWNWREWPEPYQRPDSPEVLAFAARNADRVEFHQYLEWLADRQLAAAAAEARAAGLTIGFYRDLAVANNPGGSAAWAFPDVVLPGASVGAPPDLFNMRGQNWGLSPLSPLGLRETAYAIFIQGVRANMRHAGAVRIDHAMALRHLFWIPDGDPRTGAYVAYPERDLVRILALESHRNRCLVIGEDLGTVPEGFRPAMQAANVLSCQVLYFERDEQGEFLAPEAYRDKALVSVSTHDLPTLKGFWTGRDQDLRRDLNLYPDEAAYREDVATRRQDRARLVAALRRAGLIERDIPVPAEDAPKDMPAELIPAVHCFLARTPGYLLMVQLEDALGEREQPNLPGTIDQHPNWRRKVPLGLEALGQAPDVRALAEAVRTCRAVAAFITTSGRE